MTIGRKYLRIFVAIFWGNRLCWENLKHLNRITKVRWYWRGQW